MSVDPGEECDDGNGMNGDGCDNNCTATACGNGAVSLGEQCDDGGAASGDCCSATCQFESMGSVCDDGAICTNMDSCDGAGTCAGSATPLAMCRGTAAGRSALLLKATGVAASDRLRWKLAKGDPTLPGEFADPVASNSYTLCVYDASVAPQPRLAAAAPAGSKWRATGTGFRYRDSTRTPDGLLNARLKPGESTITVKGKGENLDLPAVGSLVPPITVQLRRAGGGCWGASFSTPTASGPTLFKAKND